MFRKFEFNRLLSAFSRLYLSPSFILLLTGLSVYSILLLIPPSITITQIFSDFHLGLTVLITVFFAILFARRGLGWEMLSFTLVLTLFAMALIVKWQTSVYSGQILGGYLPLSDAQHYYTDAQLLIRGYHVTAVSTRRPFFASFLALILWMTGNNLKASIAIIVVLIAISIYLTAREIQIVGGSSLGPAIYVMVCYWFYFPFAGTLMTESLGLGLGSLGLLFLLKAIQSELSLKYFSCGLFLLTVALNARQGPFFILPVIILWVTVLFYQTGRARQVFLALSLVVAAGMLINIALSRLIGTAQTTPFSIYSHFLYSLVTGGTGWPQAQIDHPGITEDGIFQLSIEIFKQHPDLLVKGVLKSYQDYFAPVNGGFSFMRLVYDQKNVGDRLLWGLFSIGIVAAVFKFNERKYGLMLAGIVGIFVSIAFLPPADSDDMRIYAAGLPFVFYVVASGATTLTSFITRKILVLPESWRESYVWNLMDISSLFSLGIIIVCVFGSMFLLLIGRHLKLEGPAIECSSNQKPILFYIGGQSSVILTEDDLMKESYIPVIRITDFANGVTSGPIYTFYPYLDQALLSLNQNNVINIVTYFDITANNFANPHGGYLVTTGEVLASGLYSACGISPKTGQSEIPFLFYQRDISTQEKIPFWNGDPISVEIIRALYNILFICALTFALIDIPVFQSASLGKKILLLGNLALIMAGIAVYLHSNALFSFSTQRIPINMERAIFVDGDAYKIPLGVDWMSQKSVRHPPVNIYEDGIPLKHPNEKIYAVKNVGKGRFFLQSGYLYISTSDNSDPRVNGKSYEIDWPTPIRPRYQWLLYVMSGISMLLYIKYFTRPGKFTVIPK